ncbi:MAG: amidase [Thermoleophilia bacterium]|nr:amidase [Thermoleophilia bacterium]
MADAELLFKPAGELAEMVRSGELSARELTELSLERAEALNPELGAFIAIDAERALAAADKIKPGDERPFAGVPTAIKDIGPFLADYPYTAGANLFGDFTPTIDSSVVRRIKDAGFVIIGKTKTPEMGILPVTEPVRYGPARNPYDTGRTPGGSSGGSAAAVAAGILPIAHGNDGGGSLRIPGACCGLIGFKPSRNRVSGAPLLAEQMLTIDMMLARSTADTAAALDVLAGYEIGDASWTPPPSAPFAEAAKRDPGRLKIGFTVKPPLDLPVDPSHVQQVYDTAKLLESLGHDVEPVEIPWDNPELMLMFTKIFGGWISTLTEFAGKVSGREVTEDSVEALTWEVWQLAQGISALEWITINATAQAFTRAIIAATDKYDAIVTPVLNKRPVPIGEIDSTKGMEAFGKAAEFASFTAGMNLSGQPAVSLPTGIGDDGLPHSVQLIGRPIGEETLLSLSAQLEQALGWPAFRPNLPL